jgi:hypothetical protein
MGSPVVESSPKVRLPTAEDASAAALLISQRGDHAAVLFLPKLIFRLMAFSRSCRYMKALATSASGPHSWMSST